jgi:hypothetical protein
MYAVIMTLANIMIKRAMNAAWKTDKSYSPAVGSIIVMIDGM